ncbi:MAG: Gfo/Idh/MocA family oxidoreductase [Armatimonadetes bacterium]|nr:Gfo/Idh/MocA family oxidoreductase [Armatimonadota bacterium]
MRVGIVGCGGMGGVHANKYAQMDGVEVWAFDIDTERLDSFVEQRGALRATSLTDLFGAVDAVDVCLPTTVHMDVVLRAMDSQKPTLVEKPMARTVEECQAMIDSSRANRTMLVPAHVVRFFPEFQAAHRVIANGEIGEPASVRLRRGGGAPKADWFLDIEKSGGILLDLAVHEFDWLNWTLGTPKLVCSRSVRLGNTVEGTEFRGDYALTTITYESGCVAHVESTWMDPGGFRVTIEAMGSGGAVEYDSRVNSTLRVSGGATENNYASGDDPYFRQLTAFLKAVSGESEPAVTAEEGMLAVAVAQAAIESATTGQPVSL